MVLFTHKQNQKSSAEQNLSVFFVSRQTPRSWPTKLNFRFSSETFIFDFVNWDIQKIIKMMKRPNIITKRSFAGKKWLAEQHSLDVWRLDIFRFSSRILSRVNIPLLPGIDLKSSFAWIQTSCRMIMSESKKTFAVANSAFTSKYFSLMKQRSRYSFEDEKLKLWRRFWSDRNSLTSETGSVWSSIQRFVFRTIIQYWMRKPEPIFFRFSMKWIDLWQSRRKRRTSMQFSGLIISSQNLSCQRSKIAESFLHSDMMLRMTLIRYSCWKFI